MTLVGFHCHCYNFCIAQPRLHFLARQYTVQLQLYHLSIVLNMKLVTINQSNPSTAIIIIFVVDVGCMVNVHWGEQWR